MATKAKATTKSKAASSRKAPARAASAKVVSSKSAGRLAVVTPQALVAEAVGTFGLALAALTAPADQPLLVGLALAVLLVGMMRVSGGHFNPAITFGLWAANKLDWVKVPFYWVSQLIGALAALMVVGQYNGNGSSLDLSTFSTWDWRVFFVEFIGAAIFLFGIVAVLKNVSSNAGRAAGIGLSLVAGLVVAGGLLTANATREQTLVQSGKETKVSTTFAAQGAALNPAIALAQTERDVNAINKSIAGETSSATEKKASHFTLSVVLGSLVGAAAGTNLYMLVTGMSWKKREL